jgi:hypothetical protein
MITVEFNAGRWDGLRLQLPVIDPPKKLYVTDEGHVIMDEEDIGEISKYEDRE